jgi:uncharacterized protein (TIGR02217 family)
VTITIDDVRLPDKWSKGSAGGPEFRTDVVPLASGSEYRERRWMYPRSRYESAHNVKTPEQIAELRAFHRARAGRHRGFLLKDWVEFTSAANGVSAPSMTDCPLGTGDGATTAFQLVKRYGDTVSPFDQPIKWPVAGTLKIAQDGVLQTTGWSVARGTGIVTFTAAPADGVVLTAGFEFDVPVRFDDDWLSVTWDTINSRSAGQVPLLEVRE